MVRVHRKSDRKKNSIKISLTIDRNFPGCSRYGHFAITASLRQFVRFEYAKFHGLNNFEKIQKNNRFYVLPIGKK